MWIILEHCVINLRWWSCINESAKMFAHSTDSIILKMVALFPLGISGVYGVFAYLGGVCFYLLRWLACGWVVACRAYVGGGMDTSRGGTFIKITIFLRKSKHAQSRISSRDRQYLRFFHAACGYKLFSISAKFWKLPSHSPGLLRGDLFLFRRYENVLYNG